MSFGSVYKMQLGKVISLSILLSSSVLAETTLDLVEGYDNLSVTSKAAVESYITRLDECAVKSMREYPDNYPVKDWIRGKVRSERIAIVSYHSEYNFYMCADKERNNMYDVMNNNIETDKHVLQSMYTRSNVNLIDKPQMPPWLSVEDKNNLENLTKEYTKPFSFYDAFVDHYEDANKAK